MSQVVGFKHQRVCQLDRALTSINLKTMAPASRAKIDKLRYMIATGGVCVRGEDGVVRPMVAPLFIARGLKGLNFANKFAHSVAQNICVRGRDFAHKPWVSIKQYNVLFQLAAAAKARANAAGH